MHWPEICVETGQGRYQLYSSDTTMRGDLGGVKTGNPKEEQHQKAKARTKMLSDIDFAGLFHSTNSVGPEFSPC